MTFRCCTYLLLAAASGAALIPLVHAEGVIGVQVGASGNPPGARIESVVPGSAAAAAGLLPDDVVLRVDDHPVWDGNTFRRAMQARQPGDEVVLIVACEGKAREFRVTVADRDAKVRPSSAPVSEAVKDAMEELKDVDAEYKVDARRPGKPVVQVKLNARHIADGTLQCLADLKELETLVIDGSDFNKKFTGKGLGYLKDLPKLKNLSLVGGEFTDAHLHYLPDFPALETLHLDKIKITNVGLGRLSECKNLKVLSLRETAVSDEGLKALEPLTGLTGLDLFTTKVRGPGLKSLKGMTNLHMLDLEYTSVGDASLDALESLKALRELDLSHTKVTDAGLVHLKGMTELTWLGLNYTGAPKKEKGAGESDPSFVSPSPLLLDGFEPETIGITTKGLEENLKSMTKLRILLVRGPDFEAREVRGLAKILPRTRIETSVKTVGPGDAEGTERTVERRRLPEGLIPLSEEITQDAVKDVVRLVNAERQKAGVDALSVNGTLTAAAGALASNIAAKGQDDMRAAITNSGYDAHEYAAVYWSGRDPAGAIRGWMQDSRLRAYVLGAQYAEVGAGRAVDENGSTTYYVVFGKSN